MRRYDVKPSILHCHDWQSAPVAWGDRGSARVVFTIHNLSYGVDLIARAMQACEVATTVSPTYAAEVRVRLVKGATGVPNTGSGPAASYCVDLACAGRGLRLVKRMH